MNPKIVNLLRWQKSRGLRFPFFHLEEGLAATAQPVDYLFADNVFKCACPLSKREVLRLPRYPDALFFSCVSFRAVQEDREWKDLLGKITAAMKLKANSVFHLSSSEAADEINIEALARIIRDVRPVMLIILGQEGLSFFPNLAHDGSLVALRGKILSTPNLPGQKILTTWHPEELVSQPMLKKDVWSDMQLAMHEIAARA